MLPIGSPAGQFPLLKLHGSFNWLWSRVTGDLYFGGLNKTIAKIFDGPSETAPELPYWYEGRGRGPPGQLTSDLEPILITSTHLKDLRNRHLGVL
jgi:hypothetical protein